MLPLINWLYTWKTNSFLNSVDFMRSTASILFSSSYFLYLSSWTKVENANLTRFVRSVFCFSWVISDDRTFTYEAIFLWIMKLYSQFKYYLILKFKNSNINLIKLILILNWLIFLLINLRFRTLILLLKIESLQSVF